MKFVKENLVLVICGAIVLLSLAVAFYIPWGPRATLVSNATEEYKRQSGTIQSMAGQTLKIPGVPEGKGVPAQNYIDAKKTYNNQMKEQAQKVVTSGAEANRHNRVELEKDEKGVVTGVVPLLDGKKEPKFLPQTQRSAGADPMAFKEDYGNIFANWIQQLTGQKPADAAMPYAGSIPPVATDLSTAFANTRANAPHIAGMTAAAPNDNQLLLDYQRREVMRRATSLHMYVDFGAFQVRSWLESDVPPSESNMFNALVDTWFQSDVVHAIAALNDQALAKAPAKNVGNAPVKRLMRIAVGSDALTTKIGTFGQQGAGGTGVGYGASQQNGPLFMLPQQVQQVTATGDENAEATAQQPASPTNVSLPNNIDVTRSLTGRASGTDYDVVLMTINIDVEPGSLNKFIDELYRQNMGYTVLNVRLQTVDPLDRASNGYIYGEKQVVEAEILVEGLLFRPWTQPLMPLPTRAILGIPADAPSPPPAQ